MRRDKRSYTATKRQHATLAAHVLTVDVCTDGSYLQPGVSSLAPPYTGLSAGQRIPVIEVMLRDQAIGGAAPAFGAVTAGSLIMQWTGTPGTSRVGRFYPGPLSRLIVALSGDAQVIVTVDGEAVYLGLA